MGENEVLLQKAWEGLNHLLTTGQINETFIGLLYFIKSINEDNLQIGLTDNEVEDLFDEDKVSIFALKELSSVGINDPMVKIWEETIKKLSELYED